MSEDSLREVIVDCSSGPVTISGIAGSDGSLTKAQHFTCEALTCSFGELNGSLSGSERTSWNRGESCAVTCAEECQAANEISGTLTCACDEAAGDVALEVAVSKRLLVVCSLDDPSTGVRHECRDFSYKGSCGATCKEGCEAGGSISTTFAQTVFSSGLQMF